MLELREQSFDEFLTLEQGMPKLLRLGPRHLEPEVVKMVAEQVSERPRLIVSQNQFHDGGVRKVDTKRGRRFATQVSQLVPGSQSAFRSCRILGVPQT